MIHVQQDTRTWKKEPVPIYKKRKLQLKKTCKAKGIIGIVNDEQWPDKLFIEVAQKQKKTEVIRKARSYLEEVMKLEKKFQLNSIEYLEIRQRIYNLQREQQAD
jgi:hypothetical protein